MPGEIKTKFLEELEKKYGQLRKINESQSLYEIGKDNIKIYVRYSKLHGGNKTFYGLRQTDLKVLEGCPSFICFLWDSQKEPLILPYQDYEEIFNSVSPSSDGQFKVQIYLQLEGKELYLARAGRFNIEGYKGFNEVDSILARSKTIKIPDLSHSQIQTLLGFIGFSKGYDIWIPINDRAKLDWKLVNSYDLSKNIPHGFEAINNILKEVDIIWSEKGSGKIKALFEVEHSTPIYSGLLRLNDVHLIAPNLNPRFNIVSNETRRSIFVKQVNRPTFKMSGLNDLCTFFEYFDVFKWYRNMEIRNG